jgi:AraC-like DNA-binding protein
VRQLFPTGSGTLLHRAKLFVKDNLAQPLTLEDVAAYLHISPRHLSRLFSIQLGVPYSSFVRQERIRAAAELLATTDRSIKHIAEETGFASVHYFTRVFTAEKGVTPGQFRRRRE